MLMIMFLILKMKRVGIDMLVIREDTCVCMAELCEDVSYPLDLIEAVLARMKNCDNQSAYFDAWFSSK